MSMMEEFSQVLPGLAMRYKHWRKESMLLNNEIMNTINKDTWLQAAEMLGMLHGQTIVAEEELATDFLAECALYGVFTDGENVVQRFRRNHPQTNPVWQKLLDAQSQPIFTLIGIRETCPAENALVVEDLFLDNKLMLLADHNLSLGATVDEVFYIRMFQVENFWMSTGLGMPMGMSTQDPILQMYIASGKPGSLRSNPENWEILHGVFAADLMKTLLTSGASVDDDNDYADSDDDGDGDVEFLQSERIERNAPCPCGSGKKYKKCCGR